MRNFSYFKRMSKSTQPFFLPVSQLWTTSQEREQMKYRTVQNNYETKVSAIRNWSISRDDAERTSTSKEFVRTICFSPT